MSDHSFDRLELRMRDMRDLRITVSLADDGITLLRERDIRHYDWRDVVASVTLRGPGEYEGLSVVLFLPDTILQFRTSEWKHSDIVLGEFVYHECASKEDCAKRDKLLAILKANLLPERLVVSIEPVHEIDSIDLDVAERRLKRRFQTMRRGNILSAVGLACLCALLCSDAQTLGHWFISIGFVLILALFGMSVSIVPRSARKKLTDQRISIQGHAHKVE